MARWKARVEFLLSVIELLFLSLTVEALHGKMCQNSQPSGGGRSLAAKFSGKGASLGNIFFGFYKTRHILLSDGANQYSIYFFARKNVILRASSAITSAVRK